MESSEFWLEGVLPSIVAAALLWLATSLWNRASPKASGKLAKRITKNRRNFTVLVICITVGVALSLYIAGYTISDNDVIYLSALCTITIIIHLIMELSRFWSIGFNYIDRSVSGTTYRDALAESFTDFVILSTNAYSLCKIDSLEDSFKRIRENGGSVSMILAHPDSLGLREAARGRGKSEDLYKEQALFGLGMLSDMSDRIGCAINIKLYNAYNIEQLPIFRIMLINSNHAIASISVYGRQDHGRSLPQFFAHKTGLSNSHGSIYSVLHRYTKYFGDNSYSISDGYREKAISSWREYLANPELMSKLEG